MPILELPGDIHMRYERMYPTIQPDGPSSHPTLVVIVPFMSAPLETLPQLAPGSLLREQYEIIALAPRSHGETTTPITAESDIYVGAAELAFAYKALEIPPCPLFAPSTIGSRIALAFAVLFPNLTTAIALASLGTRKPRRNIAQLVGFCEVAVNGEDPEIVVDMFTELASTLGGKGQTTEQRDALVLFLLQQGGPRKTARSYERMVLWYLEAKLPPNVLADIRQPVLLMYGEHDDDTLPDNDDWTLLLSGSSHVQVELIPNTPKWCWLSDPSTVSRVTFDFFCVHELPQTSDSTTVDFSQALGILSTVTLCPVVRERDPNDPQSFTALTEEEVEERRVALMRVYACEERWCAAHEAPDPWDRPKAETDRDFDDDGDEGEERWSPRAHVENRFPMVSSPPMVSPPMVSETVTVKVAVSHDPYPIQPRKHSVVSVESDKSQ